MIQKICRKHFTGAMGVLDMTCNGNLQCELTKKYERLDYKPV